MDIQNHLLRLFHKKADATNADDVEVLTPVIRKEELDHYTRRLNIAINKNDVKNIAICGNYGSGKSSIINTFIDIYRNNYIYLKVSLAGFNKSKQTDRDIEHSLVQQFFYHVKYDNIPFSRFRRIKRITKFRIFSYSLSVFAYICAWLFLLSPSLFEKLGVRTESVCEWVRYLADAVIAIGTPCIIFILIKFILRISYVHLKVSEYEINLNKDKNISTFNKYLDELIYLFESSKDRKTHIVIIEDIDRLKECPMIFTKLREINILLNQAKDINKRIVFIYALKEDVFDDYLEKTKFFDYILSVIPKANASNAVHDFYEKFENEITINNGNEVKTDNEFLMDVAPFIPDIRSIKCIKNDYFLFKDILRDNNPDRRKLLAMVIYKNIYPADYASLHENKGHLHALFQNKQLLISEDEKRIRNEIEKVEAEIESRNSRLEEERLKNTDELKALLVAEFLKQLSESYPVDENNNLIELNKLFSDEYIEKILNGKIKGGNLNVYYRNTYHHIGINADFYYKRKELFEKEYAEKTESLKLKRESLLKELACIQRKSMKELCDNDPDALKKINAPDGEKSEQEKSDYSLLNMMIRKGYIAEDHCFYITVFKEGMMTHNDIEFLKNIHGAETDNNRDIFAEKIDHPEVILEYMYNADFSKDDVLNGSLVNYIYASGDKYNDRKKLLVSKITSYSVVCLDFVCRFLTSPDDMNSYTKGLLLNDIVRQDGSLWTKIVQDTDSSSESLGHIFSSIIKYLDVSLFKRLDVDHSFSYYFAKQYYPDFQNITTSNKFIEIIESLNVKFTYIAHNQNKFDPVLEAIRKGCHYVLNAQNIDFIISTFGKVRYSVSDTGLYSKAMESGCMELKDYIRSNINDFIRNVYVDNNLPNETDGYLIELINNETLSPQYRVLITRRSSNRLEDISQIKPQHLPAVLTAESCAGFNIGNLEYAYANSNHKQIENWIIIYINNNAEDFATCVKNLDRRFSDNTLAYRLFICNDIDDTAYLALLEHPEIRKDFPKKYTDISISHLELAIRAKVISLTLENWNTLKKLSTDIALDLLQHNLDSLKRHIPVFGFSNEDLKLILNDRRFSTIYYEIKRLLF